MARKTNDHQGRKNSAASSNSHRRVSSQWLRDFLSEMLTVEKGGVKLYEKALENLSHQELESQLNEFLEETRHHVELCQEMLVAAGAEEEYMSSLAELADEKAEALLGIEASGELTDANHIENLVLAETKDSWDWNMLEAILDQIEDKELRNLARKATREVRKQENEHLDWNEKTLTWLALESATQKSEAELEEEEGMTNS